MNKKTKEALIKRIKPGIIYSVVHGQSTEFVKGYNTMLEKAIKIIENY